MKISHWIRIRVVLGTVTGGLLLPAAVRGADFENDVARPVIRSCLACHNPSEARGNLDLTRREGLLRGGKSGPAVVPGQPGESLLLDRVHAGAMPPKDKGAPLRPGEVAALTAWIRGGAVWPRGRVLSPLELTTERRAGYDWWALQPVSQPAPPPVRDTSWPRNPVDRFILDRLERHGLQPAPPADRLTFLRRVTFDLLGLPPTPGEVDAYLADVAPGADERLVERLLASPHHGERWGRHWLDVARFGESDGFENDKLRDHAWRYRDYVVQAFNDDKPYPQFIREQLAGDVLAPVTRARIAATGFLVAGPFDEIQNVAKSVTERTRAREEQLEELVGAVSQTFLGLTVQCARCHDHKFDPVAQEEYYRVKAVFDGVDPGNRPLLTPAEQAGHEAAVKPLQARAAALRGELAGLDARLGSAGTEEPLRPEALVAGKFGKALDARRGRLAVRARPALQTPPLTVELWAKLDGRAGFNILVANQRKESGGHWELYTLPGTGVFNAFLPGYQPSTVSSGVAVADGKWHYLALQLDGKRARLFVDANLAQDVRLTPQADPGPPGLFWVGAYPPQKLGCDGLVDEVRVSSAVRPLNRVPEAPFEADAATVALWHFDRAEEDPGARPGVAPAAQDPELVKRRDAVLAELKQRETALAQKAVPLVYAGTRRQPGPTTVYLRGDVQKPGPQVAPGGLPALRGLPDIRLSPDAPEGERRLRFADWVADPRNPLTARVLVNRVWHYHFGQGLVETPSDLGFHGGRPSHPELLDWLAQEFTARGGSVKHLHRLIALSAAYRQSARHDPRAARLDADNRLLGRFAPRRLEAEAVRDAMLAVSGALNPQVGGPSFRPFTVRALLTHFYDLHDRDTPELNRRTVYRVNVNTGKSPFLDALDCPAPSLAAPRRRSTTTPIQALALMNDSFVQRQAGRLADRVRQAAGPDPGDQAAHAYRLALGRPPTGEERAATVPLIRAQGLPAACWVLLNASEFLYVR